jgi:hypothetical protein
MLNVLALLSALQLPPMQWLFPSLPCLIFPVAWAGPPFIIDLTVNPCPRPRWFGLSPSRSRSILSAQHISGPLTVSGLHLEKRNRRQDPGSCWGRKGCVLVPSRMAIEVCGTWGPEYGTSTFKDDPNPSLLALAVVPHWRDILAIVEAHPRYVRGRQRPHASEMRELKNHK